MGARKTLKKASETSNVNAGTPAPSHVPGDGIAIRMTRKELRAIVARFAGIVDRKSTMPILANVTIRAFDDGVTVTGTDLNVSLRVNSPATVIRTGGISLNHKRLGDILKSLPDGDVTVHVDGRIATFECGAARVTLEGMHERDTPRFPDFAANTWIPVPACDVRSIFESVADAVCRDDTRFHLNGVFFEATDAVLRGVATDGHRLFKAERPSHGTSLRLAKGVVIPARGIAAATKAMKGHALIGMAIKAPFAWFQIGDATLAVKCIDAQFPPYEQVIPRHPATVITCDREALVGAVTRAKVNCCETRGLELAFADGTLLVKSSHPDFGETSEPITAAIERLTRKSGDDEEGKVKRKPACDRIGVNPTYLLAALAALDTTGDECTLAVTEDLDPIVVRSLDDYAMADMRDAEFLAVIMPMRI